MRAIVTLFTLGTLGLAASAAALSAADFEASPSFTETFNGPVGQWELDPDNLSGASMATFGASPVAGSSDNAVMIQGNPSSTNGTLYGLNYMRCVNSLANGSGTSFTALTKYRVVARLYLKSQNDVTPAGTRWQVGPYALDRSASALFRPSSFYNTSSTGTGGGPGFGYRAYNNGSSDQNTGTISGTSALTTSRWTLMSVMVDMTDADSANWKLAVCVDADGDGLLEENDPLEYVNTRLASTATAGPPGVFTVGEVNSDEDPLYVDTLELYMPATSSVSDWSIY